MKKPLPEEIVKSQKLLDDYYTILFDEKGNYYRKHNLSWDELKYNQFIVSGKKDVKLQNFCSALHKKNYPVKIKGEDFILNHEDHARIWEFISVNNPEDKRYIFNENDVNGHLRYGEGNGIEEIWEDYEPKYLSLLFNRWYNSPVEKYQLDSLLSSNL